MQARQKTVLRITTERHFISDRNQFNPETWIEKSTEKFPLVTVGMIQTQNNRNIVRDCKGGHSRKGYPQGNGLCSSNLEEFLYISGKSSRFFFMPSVQKNKNWRKFIFLTSSYFAWGKPLRWWSPEHSCHTIFRQFLVECHNPDLSVNGLNHHNLPTKFIWQNIIVYDNSIKLVLLANYDLYNITLQNSAARASKFWSWLYSVLGSYSRLISPNERVLDN